MQSKVMSGIRKKQVIAKKELTFDEFKARLEKLGLKPKGKYTAEGGNFEKKDKDYENTTKLLLKVVQFLDNHFERKKVRHTISYGYKGSLDGINTSMSVSISVNGLTLYYFQ